MNIQREVNTGTSNRQYTPTSYSETPKASDGSKIRSPSNLEMQMKRSIPALQLFVRNVAKITGFEQKSGSV